MDDIDSILNDFDAIYDKANQQANTRSANEEDEDEDELDVMDFMTSQPAAGKHLDMSSLESAENLDEEVASFIRKNSKTDNGALLALQGENKKKKKKKKGPKDKKHVTLSDFPEPMSDAVLEEEPVMDEPMMDEEPVMDEEVLSEEAVSEAESEDVDPALDGEDSEEYEKEEAEEPETLSPQAQQKERPYQTDMTRPVVQYGNTKLTYGEAKLYGLLDENGQVKLKKNDSSFARSREAVLHSRAMAERKERKAQGPSEEEKEMTFKPTKSKEALKAMKSRSCGYDFVGRIEERGDFLQRAFTKGEKGKTEKRMHEAQREDYEARLDRLKCPNCNKFQSYDEYVEKKRSCQQCQERYVKSSVSHPKAYAQKQAEAERRKQERLKKLEEELYPSLPKPTGRPAGKSLIERTNELMVAQKEQARFEQEQKRRKAIEAAAKARAPPRPVTQPVHVAVAEAKPPQYERGEKSTRVGTKTPKNKFTGVIKKSIMSEKFNELIKYPKDSIETK